MRSDAEASINRSVDCEFMSLVKLDGAIDNWLLWAGCWVVNATASWQDGGGLSGGILSVQTEPTRPWVRVARQT